MDAGIIASFKAQYKRLFTRYALNRDDQGIPDIYKIEQLDAMRLADAAWGAVTPQTISNCWKHTGICLQPSPPLPLAPFDMSLDISFGAPFDIPFDTSFDIFGAPLFDAPLGASFDSSFDAFLGASLDIPFDAPLTCRSMRHSMRPSAVTRLLSLALIKTASGQHAFLLNSSKCSC
jgi:hypothetical protein